MRKLLTALLIAALPLGAQNIPAGVPLFLTSSGGGNSSNVNITGGSISGTTETNNTFNNNTGTGNSFTNSTETNMTLLGSFTMGGGAGAGGYFVYTPAPMGALAIDITQEWNTVNLTGSTTGHPNEVLTFSGVPSATVQQFSVLINNTDSVVHNPTIPSSYSFNRGGTSTGFTILPGTSVLLTWDYDGTVYWLRGDPVYFNNLTGKTTPVSADIIPIGDSAANFATKGLTWANLLAAIPGGGTVTHTVGALTSNAVVLGNGAADTYVVAGITTDGTSKLNLGVAGTSVGSVVLANATSGTITLSPPTGALGTVTVTVPAATDTLVNLGSTQTITGAKTFSNVPTNFSTNTAGVEVLVKSTNSDNGVSSGNVTEWANSANIAVTGILAHANTAHYYTGDPAALDEIVFGSVNGSSATGPIAFGTNGKYAGGFDGSTQLFRNLNIVRTTTGFTATSSTALTNVTALTYTLNAGATYSFHAWLPTTATTAGGVQFAIAGTCTATNIVYEGVLDSAGVLTQTRAASLGTAVGSLATATAGTCIIDGTITVNAAGTLTVQFAQNTSNASASTVLQGATFQIQQTAN